MKKEQGMQIPFFAATDEFLSSMEPWIYEIKGGFKFTTLLSQNEALSPKLLCSSSD